MGFRLNQHDSWLHFCNLHRELLNQTKLPTTLVDSEHRFGELLRAGTVETRRAKATLAGLPNDCWAALAQVATIYFHEWESYAQSVSLPII